MAHIYIYRCDSATQDQPMFDNNENNFILTFKLIQEIYAKLIIYCAKHQIIQEQVQMDFMKFAKDHDIGEASILVLMCFINNSKVEVSVICIHARR